MNFNLITILSKDTRNLNHGGIGRYQPIMKTNKKTNQKPKSSYKIVESKLRQCADKPYFSVDDSFNKLVQDALSITNKKELESIAQLCVSLINTTNYAGGKLYIFYFIQALLTPSNITHAVKHRVYRKVFGDTPEIKLGSKKNVKPYIVECLLALQKSTGISENEKDSIKRQVITWMKNNYFRRDIQDQIRNILGTTALSEKELIEKSEQYASSMETSTMGYTTAVESTTEVEASESESSSRKRSSHLALMMDVKPKKKKKVTLGFEVHRVRCTFSAERLQLDFKGNIEETIKEAKDLEKDGNMFMVIISERNGPTVQDERGKKMSENTEIRTAISTSKHFKEFIEDDQLFVFEFPMKFRVQDRVLYKVQVCGDLARYLCTDNHGFTTEIETNWTMVEGHINIAKEYLKRLRDRKYSPLDEALKKKGEAPPDIYESKDMYELEANKYITFIGRLVTDFEITTETLVPVYSLDDMPIK